MPHHIPSLSTATSTQNNNKDLPIREVSVLFILILKSPFELFALQAEYGVSVKKRKANSHRTGTFPILLEKGRIEKQRE